MSRSARIALISSGALLLLAVLGILAVFEIGRSDWLRETLRKRIVTEAEKATGGRVEIGAFQFDWSTLTARVDNLTIHGTEPAAEAPLLRVKRVVIGFKIISLMEQSFDVVHVEADGPQANVIIQPDGATNIPQPKTTSSRKLPERILDLRIGKFDLAGGLFVTQRAGSRSSTPWNARGENLAAHLTYNAARYEGDIAVAPLNIAWNGLGKITAKLTARGSLEKNRLAVSNASVETGGSTVDLGDLILGSFTEPVVTAQYKARVSLADADRIFKLVNFHHIGTVEAEGRIRYVSLSDYTVTGAVKGAGIGYGKIQNMRVSGNVIASRDNLEINGLRVSALGGEMIANGQVKNLENFHLAGKLQDFDANALANLAGTAALPYDGILSGPFEATGKLKETDFHRIVADATLTVTPAGSGEPLHGEVAVKYDGLADTVELGHSWLELPHTRVEASGVPGKQLAVKFQSRDLNELRPVLGRVNVPFKLENGSVVFDGTVASNLENLRIAGHGAVQNVVYAGQKIDSLAGDFTATKSAATVTNAAVAWGDLRAKVTGSIGLADWKPVDTSAINANVQLTNADVPRLLTIAKQKNVPFSGTLNTTAQITGTVGDPRVTADLRLSKGQVYEEPYDSITARAQYLNGGTQLLSAAIDAGRKRLNVTARFEHSPATFMTGKLTFTASSNAMALDQIALVRRREPDIKGTAQIKAGGTLEINRASVNVLDLNADLNATALGQGPRSFGNLHFTAETKNDVMTARLESNAARAAIQGEGTVRLDGDYPIDGKLTFANVGLNAVAAALLPQHMQENFDGSAAGEITIRGPAKNLDQIIATVDIPQLELHPLKVTGSARNIPNLSLKNTRPIQFTLARSVVRVENAHFEAPETNLDLTGTVNLKDASPLNLRVQGNANLELAQSLSPDLMASGELLINATIRGGYISPDVSGRAELQKGDFHYVGFSNGLANANGVITFNGTGLRANIQSFRAESGGGQVEATGFAAFTAGQFVFQLGAKTKEVRFRYPEGVSTVSDSDVTLAGTSQRSEVSGTVVVHRVSINPRTDVSAILASSMQPLKTPESSQGFLSNMNLDVEIETAPDVAFETSVAQSIEADANLRLRGTGTNPAVLGRVNISQGEMVFFGNKYTINQGSVSFFNPAKIDPVLNVDLQTRARGVTVTLTLSGPINKLNLSYRSDPPLQWADIIALLATGRTPTDPTLAIRDTGQSQNLQQLGASALIGQAIANPVSGNLQRFFGVSRIKIDPQLIGITGSPEARLTIEQQVTPDLLFTYISDVSSTSTQLFQVQWDFNRKWSAILTREENGYVGLNFAYKKRFK
ncbi:MAG TPA: translocation/assembly module TamB domain-containing protein [Bryobacteraceae bacterium]|nr:translocation/assembly module TamB domain-containing protein [Bryobacteraceae bacterium]